MQTSAELDKIAPALLAIHKELRVIGKDSTNPHFKNKYASLEAITENVRPILTAHGVVPIQGETDGEKGQTIATRLLHESGQWVESHVTMPLEKATAQGAGSALTYGRRYGLSAALCLSTDEDDDGQRASERPKVTPRQTNAPTTEPAVVLATRNDRIDFGEKWKGKTVADLTLTELQWANEKPIARLPERWRVVFASELDNKQDRKA